MNSYDEEEEEHCPQPRNLKPNPQFDRNLDMQSLITDEDW